MFWIFCTYNIYMIFVIVFTWLHKHLYLYCHEPIWYISLFPAPLPPTPGAGPVFSHVSPSPIGRRRRVAMSWNGGVVGKVPWLLRLGRQETGEIIRQVNRFTPWLVGKWNWDMLKSVGLLNWEILIGQLKIWQASKNAGFLKLKVSFRQIRCNHLQSQNSYQKLKRH